MRNDVRHFTCEKTAQALRHLRPGPCVCAKQRKMKVKLRYGKDELETLQILINAESGVGELDQEKLPKLLELKYHALSDAADILGGVEKIRQTFIAFQRILYAKKAA